MINLIPRIWNFVPCTRLRMGNSNVNHPVSHVFEISCGLNRTIFGCWRHRIPEAGVFFRRLRGMFLDMVALISVFKADSCVNYIPPWIASNTLVFYTLVDEFLESNFTSVRLVCMLMNLGKDWSVCVLVTRGNKFMLFRLLSPYQGDHICKKIAQLIYRVVTTMRNHSMYTSYPGN